MSRRNVTVWSYILIRLAPCLCVWSMLMALKKIKTCLKRHRWIPKGDTSCDWNIHMVDSALCWGFNEQSSSGFHGNSSKLASPPCSLSFFNSVTFQFRLICHHAFKILCKITSAHPKINSSSQLHWQPTTAAAAVAARHAQDLNACWAPTACTQTRGTLVKFEWCSAGDELWREWNADVLCTATTAVIGIGQEWIRH